jgi:catechol 2,3-dioxygenase-like lactoylglutathione lyase family enzyme
VTTVRAGDETTDTAALRAFAEEFGEQATKLPPVAIVIAAYNEEGAIGPVVEALPRTFCGLAAAAIVVSDGAVDATAKEARTAGALVCDVPVNRGQGAALRLGYRLAREGGAQYIVTTDADGQYNPAEIESLLAPILAGQADFVTGSRKLGSEETKDPVRKLGVRVFALTISLLTGQHVSDTTFGLRAMRAEVTGAVLLEQPQYQAAELLIGVITHGYRVVERPATIHRRQVGKSKKGNNAFYAVSFAQVVLGTWWRERQRRRRGSSSVRLADPTGPTGREPDSGALADGTIANESAVAPEPAWTSAAGSPGPASRDPRSTKRK